MGFGVSDSRLPLNPPFLKEPMPDIFVSSAVITTDEAMTAFKNASTHSNKEAPERPVDRELTKVAMLILGICENENN